MTSAPGPPDPPPAGEAQRYGPLLLRRFRKDDGRALILFSRQEEPPAGAGETP
jgi:hypothetical protein